MRTETKVWPPDLRGKALRALADKRRTHLADVAEAHERRRGQARENLAAMLAALCIFGADAPLVTGTTESIEARVTVGTLDLAASAAGYYYLVGRCPRCQSGDAHQTFKLTYTHGKMNERTLEANLVDLALALEELEKGKRACYACQQKAEDAREEGEAAERRAETEPTLAERLESLIRLIVRDEVGQ